MAQQSFAGLAVLIALTFAIMALHGCANSEHTAQLATPGVQELPPYGATPEFHGADIGGDALRSRLNSEG